MQKLLVEIEYNLGRSCLFEWEEMFEQSGMKYCTFGLFARVAHERTEHLAKNRKENKNPKVSISRSLGIKP